jgi:stage II sporulation protein D
MKPRWRNNWLTSEDQQLNHWAAFASGLLVSILAWFIVHNGGIRDGYTRVAVFEQEQAIVEESIEPNTIADNTSLYNKPKSPNKAAAKENHSGALVEIDSQPTVRVFLSDSHTIETVTLEAYVRGVVAAEMPLEFEPEALEAQAMAARTYIIRRLWMEDSTGNPVVNADVTDTQTHQVYRSLSEMKRLMRENEAGWRKVDDAVRKTAGQVIVYRDEPIEALFFSASNGFTENSEDVFPAKLPYLRSVASPWDKENSPRSRDTVELRLTDFYEKLGVKSMPASVRMQGQANIRILDWTQGRRVKQIQAGAEKISGEEVRHRLGLRSAAFDWKFINNKIVITTYGSGHGVGMSQWGAEGMAKAGKTAAQIVEYYYSGTRTEKVSKLAKAFGKVL